MCKHDDGCNAPEGECSGACMKQDETLEVIAQRHGDVYDNTVVFNRTGHFNFNNFMCDPAILDHIPVVVSLQQQVKALREENERLKVDIAEIKLTTVPAEQVADHTEPLERRILVLEAANRCLEAEKSLSDARLIPLAGELERLKTQLAEMGANSDLLRQGGEAVAWRIRFKGGNTPDGFLEVHYHGHSAIGDYRQIDPEAISEPLFTRPQPAIPPGYVVVPIEPTKTQIRAGQVGVTTTCAIEIYKQMLAVAPSVPVAEKDEKDAARYRYLTSIMHITDNNHPVCKLYDALKGEVPSKEQLDAAIDAAMLVPADSKERE